jgi:soluble lytic murein transglycosylase-like protein
MSVVPSRPIKIRADKKVVKKAPARTAAVSRYRKLPSRVTRLNWHALAACESGGRPGAVSRNGKYRGMYQFSVGTWRGVGGRGLPNKASKVEQTYRAQLLFMRRGAAPWPVCGKRLYR